MPLTNFRAVFSGSRRAPRAGERRIIRNSHGARRASVRAVRSCLPVLNNPALWALHVAELTALSEELGAGYE
jgi:hypothetical protein